MKNPAGVPCSVYPPICNTLKDGTDMVLPKKDDAAKTQNAKTGKTATMKKAPVAAKKQDVAKPAAAKPKK